MQHALPRSAPRTLTLLGLAALLLLAAIACGRKGDPRPRSELTPEVAPAAAASPAPAGR